MAPATTRIKWLGHETYNGVDNVLGQTLKAAPGDEVEVHPETATLLLQDKKWQRVGGVAPAAAVKDEAKKES